MTSSDLRKIYLDFFVSQNHKVIPSAPLVPENDPTTLFTSSGMQPLVPYLLGQTHPEGKRLCNSQPSFRSQDIEEVGDNRHTTFFEMLGNWSLGDYFKEEQLSWFWEFLTKKLNLDSKRLYVSVFEGNKQIPKDTVSFEIWKKLGVPSDHTFFYGVKNNWWSRSGIPENMPAGEIGGPDSEVFYEFTQVEHNKKYGEECHPNCDCGRFLEIGNSVFMEYQKQGNGSLKELPQKNVDFGGGLERLLMAVNDEPDIFKIDLFWPIIEKLEEIMGAANKYNDENYPLKREMRIIADHLKSAVFLINSGITPSNKMQGYILRRYLRRVAIKIRTLGGAIIPNDFLSVTDVVLDIYNNIYLDKTKTKKNIDEVILSEVNKFNKTLDSGLKEIEAKPLDEINERFAFDLFQTFGFPFEITQEILVGKGKFLDKKKFDEDIKKHQELSRTASAGMFKGGLADSGEEATKLHTATHLLHQALRTILGTHVSQKGSNITSVRLRFDFSHPRKMTPLELQKVENLVNQKIKENLPVSSEIKTLARAEKEGALAFFAQKYGEKVKVYSMGTFSQEVCAGPHASFTGELERFKIIKEESAGSGIRRIYAKVG